MVNFCFYGCGKKATHTIVSGKNKGKHVCQKKPQNGCPAIISRSENNRKNDPKRNDKIRKGMNKIDTDSGLTKAQLAANRARETNLKIDPETNRTHASLNTEKSWISRRNNIDPVTGKSMVDVAIEKTIEKKAMVDPVTGLSGIDKAFVSGFQSKYYFEDKSLPLIYRGSYEKIFLDKKFSELGEKLFREYVKNGPSFKYINPVTNKSTRYFSDYIIDGVVYEIKSCWTFDECGKNTNKRLVNLFKLKTVQDAGFSIILVLDGEEITNWTLLG
jgi:hypothetical protein